MVEPIYIAGGVGLALGIFSKLKDDAFFLIILIFLPVLYFLDMFYADKAPQVRTVSGDNASEIFTNFMNNIPEHLRGPLLIIVPAFFAGRLLASLLVWMFPKKELTPSEKRAKKKKTLQSYGME